MMNMIIAAGGALGIALSALWLISIWTQKVSFIDAFWGTGFLLVAVAAAHGLPQIGSVQALYLTLLSLWALRLSLYLLRRFLAHGEDKRYVRIIGPRTGLGRHLFTLGIVFHWNA